MQSIRTRLAKLEQQARPTANIWEPRLARVVCRRYAREVAAGTRKPEDATPEAALAELRNSRSPGGSLEERMKAAILRGKPQREQGRSAH